MVWRKELSHVVSFNKMHDLKALLARTDIRCGLENLTRWDEQAGGAPLHWAALCGKIQYLNYAWYSVLMPQFYSYFHI